MWERLETDEAPQMHDPVLLVSLSTGMQQYRALYSHGRELAKFMLRRMEFRRLAVMYSSALPPIALVSDEGMVRLSSASFHHFKGERDVILVAGDASPVEEQYEFCDAVLEYAKELGVKDVISTGTRWTEEVASPTEAFRVKGFATDPKGVEELQALGVEILRDEPAPYFSSLIVALTERHGMRGYKLSVDHGEPIPHPRSVAELLSVLQRMLGFKVETGDLEKAAETMASELQAGPGPSPPPRKGDIYG